MKNFGLKIIKESDVIKEETMSVILGGGVELSPCIIQCKDLCVKNSVSKPEEPDTTK